MIAGYGAHVGGTARRAQGADWRPEELTVDRQERPQRRRQAAILVNGLGRTGRLADPTVDALVRVDIQRAPAGVDAIDRTALHAGAVLDIDAASGDDVGHDALLSALATAAFAFAGTRARPPRRPPLAGLPPAWACAGDNVTVCRTTCLIAFSDSGAQARIAARRVCAPGFSAARKSSTGGAGRRRRST